MRSQAYGISKNPDPNITPSLDRLHWLSIAHRIIYKTVLLFFKSVHGLSPLKIDSCLNTRCRPFFLCDYTFKQLHSGSSLKKTNKNKSKTTTGERAFSVCAPKLWNSLQETIKYAMLPAWTPSRLN